MSKIMEMLKKRSIIMCNDSVVNNKFLTTKLSSERCYLMVKKKAIFLELKHWDDSKNNKFHEKYKHKHEILMRFLVVRLWDIWLTCTYVPNSNVLL